MRMINICVAFSLCTSVLGCGMGNRVKLSDAAQKSLGDQSAIYKSTAERPASQPESGQQCVDYAAETEVSEKCLSAWRMAIDGKVDEGMKTLEALDKKYPNMKTVSLMKGQILEHAGRKEEALKFYKAAVVGDEFDSMKLFKLAELERQTGKEKDAISDYHKLLATVPNFAPAELGLAKAVMKGNSKSPEAKKYLQQVLDADPGGSDKATVEARALLDRFASSDGSKQK